MVCGVKWRGEWLDGVWSEMRGLMVCGEVIVYCRVK